ncbi:MAG: UDP-N-acetylmuramate dehydrogenase [Clostridia bacterium]|nr:UDP-N-acetylmuramate dehydrogenase [Clostridia bacterium]
MFETDGGKIFDKVSKINDFSFSKNTTYGLGGTAKTAYFPKTEQEAIVVFDYLSEKGEKFVVLGCGSNVLAADGVFNGSVICTKYLREISLKDGRLCCMSGVTVGQLLSYCKSKSLSGLEYLAGIPATIGGLTLMNGGINSDHICENVTSVRIYDGKVKELPRENCNFGIKHSIMRDIKCIILGINLSVFAVPREAVEKNVKQRLSARHHLPKGKSCGCVFKNPAGLTAGKLIEDAGLKGCRIGGAVVSESHANFIINEDATAADVYRLIQLVKERVYIKYGVKLEEEVVYIGEFNDFNG